MTGAKVPAAQSTLRILRFLASRKGPVAASSIATALELPRSSVYHLLAVMTEQGFVVHLPEERLYGLGIAAFELSSAYTRQDPMARLGEPLLRALVDAVGENAHLAVMHGRDVVYVVEERAPYKPSLVTNVGVRIPAHLTASGRSMLAGLPAAQVRALYPDRDSFASRWESTAITTPGQLRAELSRTRERGWAVEEGDVTPNFASVAVAAHDHRGLPVAGVALTFLGHKIDDERRAELVGHVRRTAEALTRRLHGAVPGVGDQMGGSGPAVGPCDNGVPPWQ